ncbi:MAG: glycosyltransferase family 4 protein [Flavobacteriales bacterium]|nr:glycosyltransferase family 4 protein [Flavobacteriales bacterium]MCB9193616.1 glycosyltransferase family 4 protein [Flavobacteriales bacterium]
MRVVGISNRTRYWQYYAFNNPPEGYRYSRMLDVPWHMLKVRQQFLLHTKCFLPLKHADLYHTYNSVVANHRPWVVEVESYLPRYKPMKGSHPLFRWGQRRLASDDCKWLIFTSENTARMNRDHLVAFGVDPGKMTVVYRAVEQYRPDAKDTGRFIILFAGNGFYRKGGLELLKAFQRLGRNEAELWIVSTLAVDWGVLPDAATIAWAQRTIADDPRITLHRGIPHWELVQLMRRANVFVSTTFSDPFNNTILEAMGAQLPVICSDVSSLPEIVQQDRNGWLLPVEGRESEEIAEDIAARLCRLMDDRALLVRMGRSSLEVVRERFDLRVRNARLAELYERALH